MRVRVCEPLDKVVNHSIWMAVFKLDVDISPIIRAAVEHRINLEESRGLELLLHNIWFAVMSLANFSSSLKTRYCEHNSPEFKK